MKILVYPIVIISVFAFLGCGRKVRLVRGDQIEIYKKNPPDSASSVNEIYVYTVKTPFVTSLVDKTDYIEIKDIKFSNVDSRTFRVTEPKKNLQSRISTYYYPTDTGKIMSSFKYWDGAFGLQALTIPLKFRSKIGDGSLYPTNVETTVNIGFAGLYKWDYNILLLKKNSSVKV